MSRSYISLKKKLAAALLQMKRYDEESAEFVRIIPHEKAKTMTADQIIAVYDFHHHPIPKADGGPDEPWNLDPIVASEHQRITATETIPMIAKGKRIRRANEEAVRRLLAKDRGEPKPRSRWPKRKLRSRSSFQRRRP